MIRSLHWTARAMLGLVLIVLPSYVTGALADCVDNDGDGYGAFGDPSCPNGPDVDCDDTNGAVYPGAPEVCDGANNDCDHPNWPSLEYWLERVISASAERAEAVFAADIDGDDDVDVLSASSLDDKVAWYENTAGDGSVWTEHLISSSANGARSVFAADVDFDSDVDVLAVSEYDDKIAWYENTVGDGSVWTEWVIAAPAHQAAVYPADIDRDGDMDVPSVHYSINTISWYENASGDGTFWEEVEIGAWGSGGVPVFAADVDGDNDLDVLAASFHFTKIAWFENVTGHGFVWTERPITPNAYNVKSLFAADVDGDSDMDVLAASSSTDRVEWFENTAGNGSTWTRRSISEDTDNVASVFAIDMDGDSDVDVLSASSNDDKIALHENTAGDGSEWVERVISSSADYAQSVFAIDVDGDNDVDVLSASRNDDKIAWYSLEGLEDDSDGDGVAECAGDCDDGNPNCIDDCETDRDGDGTPFCADTCVDQDGDGFGAPGGSGYSCTGPDCNDADPNNWVSCADCVDFDNDSYHVGCDAYVTIDGPDCDDADPNNWLSCATCADVDGDYFFDGCDAYVTIGGPDCDDANGDVYPGAPQVCDGLNNDCDDPDWPSLLRWTESVISTSADGASSVFAADIDGDDDLDVLSASWFDDKVSWYEDVSGDGSVWTERVISLSVAEASAVSAADVDGDGDMDVVSGGGIWVFWHENETGDGSTWTDRSVASGPIYSPKTVVAADLDGDDDLDVVSPSFNNDLIKWFENMAGDGSAFTERIISTSADGAQTVFAADIDGDNDWDVLSASRYDHKIAWYENLSGDGSTWSERVISLSALGARSVFAADVDGDDDMDVLSASSNAVAWYENTTGDGSGWIEHLISTSIDQARSVFAIDVDGDNDVDVLSASLGDDTIAWYDNTAGDGSTWTEQTISSSAFGAVSVFAADIDGDSAMDVLSASHFDDKIARYEFERFDGDYDGDGLAICAGDCDDGNPAVFPGAPETNDGVDNQCPGDEGHGLIDEIEGESGFHDPGDTARYSWPAQPGATQYEVTRFAEPADPTDCTMTATAETSVTDPDEPPPGLIFCYLVRALAPHTGSWGQDSAGVERSNVCP